MAEENHTQMILQQQPTSQQQMQQQAQIQQQIHTQQMPQMQQAQLQLQQPQLQQQMTQSQIPQQQIQQTQIPQQIQQTQIPQQQIQQTQIPQQQIQQTQIPQQQIQQTHIQQQQQQQIQQQIQQPQMQQQLQQQSNQQQTAVTMSLGSSVEQQQQQNNQMNVSTSVPMNVTPINVSQPQQLQTISQNVNTSSGTAVQMAVSQLAPQPQAVQPGTMMSQSSMSHQTMIHPTMTMAQSPLQHVQVIQQPLSTPYLQHVYTPQQQMVFPGNLTLQHTGMGTPTLQSISGQGLSLQLQAKPTLDPKGGAGGQTLQTVNTAKGIMSAGTMMTASGQVISQKANFQQQMIGPGKSTIIHSQAGFASTNPNQTVVIGPVGVLPNQQPIFNKALADSQKGKTYAYQQALQPKSSLYSNTLPVHSSAQVFNGNHLKQITSQPQIITSQAPGTMFSQAQIFGSLASLPQGFSWTTPGNFQSPTLLQNPIILRSQQSDMFIQSPQQNAMHLPVAAASPLPATTYATTPVVSQKHKQVRVRPSTQTVAVATQTTVPSHVTVNSNTPTVRTQIRPKTKIAVPPYTNANASAPPAPQMTTTHTQTNQLPMQTPTVSEKLPALQPKFDACIQTPSAIPKPPISFTELKSSPIPIKSVGIETKQLGQVTTLPVKSQATVAPSTKVVQTSVCPTSTVSVATVGSSTVTMTLTLPGVQPSTPPKTASVAPVMTTSTTTSTETSTSPPPPSLPEDVEIEVPTLDVSSEPAEALQSPKKLVEEQTPVKQVEETKVVDSEPVIEPPPQPVVKPLVTPVKEKHPQKAIVKPQVLTHVIDGFVIQEGPEPFPVSRSSLLSDPAYRVLPPEKPKKTEDFQAASPVKKLKIHSTRGNKELANCEFCGILGEKLKFKRSKRFCSISCAKGRGSKRGRLLSTEENVAAGRKKGMRGRKGRRQSIVEDDSTQEREEPMQVEESAPIETEENSIMQEPVLVQNTPISEKLEEMDLVKASSDPTQKLPTKWSVQEVFEFIRDLPGCSDYADTFRSQEIDGQALLLLKEDHLMTAMCMKLGPALKLISHINSIKEEFALTT